MNKDYKENLKVYRNKMRILVQHHNSISTVSRIFEVHRNTVSKWYNRPEDYLEKYPREKRLSKFDEETFKKAIELYEQGFSLREVARRLNEDRLKKHRLTITHTTIANFIKENDKSVVLNIRKNKLS